jgi:hypothetical protein
MKTILTESKKQKMITALKAYRKRFFAKEINDLDESGTRLMVNRLLTDVLCYQSIEEIKTEYMIRGTYADYVVQTKGDRKFLVEVKALSLNLTDKHLRQAINYGANEGIDWAVLTNGKDLRLYKIIFSKPIESELVFEIDLNEDNVKELADDLQYLHRDSIIKGGLDILWKKYSATEKPHWPASSYQSQGYPSLVGRSKRSLTAKSMKKI